jgi:hypothetical protein
MPVYLRFGRVTTLFTKHVTVYGKTQPKSFFQMSMFMCFYINLYLVSNILCNTVSQIFCELLHFEMLVLENLEKSDF